MTRKPLLFGLLASTCAVATFAGATAEAAFKKVKRIDTHKLVRKRVKNGDTVSVVMPKGKNVRAIHLVTDQGELMTVDTSSVSFAQGYKRGIMGDGSDLCGSNDQISRHYTRVNQCCQEDENQQCTSQRLCKQDLAMCSDGNGGSYPSSGTPYSCNPCRPVGTSPGTTQTPGGGL